MFFLPDRTPGKPCPISASYQAIRNAAAARALADEGRRPVFALLYDARNPYFFPIGSWPGWPNLLARTLKDAERLERFWFRAASWQELISELPLDDSVREWARVKHALP